MTAARWPGEKVSIALVHYPVYNKHNEVVATSVTNLDIHDIARAARTYGIRTYFLVTPVPGQRQLVERVTTHWRNGWGATYNPHRKAALGIISIVDSLADAVEEIKSRTGVAPKTVVTSAKDLSAGISYERLGRLLQESEEQFLLVFGTGWGLTEEVVASADHALPPVRGKGDYNHLSVRSAVSIILDRLLGR